MPRSRTAPAFVYLASQSPRRAQLLDQLGVPHRPLLADADEDVESLEAGHTGERADDYVQRVTLAKLAAARARLRRRGGEPAPILVADTTVALHGVVLGKPDDAITAQCMLEWLSGRTHRVLTAVAVAWGRRSELRLNVSRVRFAPLPPQVIAAYVASGEPFGKAGAYGIQGPIAGWIERIEGSHSGIMGLPLCETRSLLEVAGLRLPR